MPIRIEWKGGDNYAPPMQVWHEGVLFQSTLAHVAIPGFSGNEPDVAPDQTWKTFWTALTPFWGDWMYSRIPMWMRDL